MRYVVAAFVALLVLNVCAEEGTNWRERVQDVVCLLVGPFNERTVPKGKTVAQILDELRPDLAEWSVIHSPSCRKKLGKLPYYPPRIAGGIEYEGAPDVGRSELWDKWRAAFGEPWQPTERDGVGIRLDGRRVEYPDLYYRWRMCHNNPRWHRFQKQSILDRVRQGNLAVMRQDNIGLPVGVTKPGGFCRWCKQRFRAFLRSRCSAERLRELGIVDLASFDIQKYFLAKGYLREPRKAIEDPLAREFMLFLYKSNLDRWNDIVDSVRRVNPDVAVCGNQGPAALNPYSSIIVSQKNDVIFLEHNVRWAYPYESSAAGLKLEQAAGRYRKPVWVWDFGYPERFESRAGAAIFLAECYANGAVPYLLMNNFTGGGPNAISTVSPRTYEVMRRYAQFARQHRGLLTRAHKTYAQVALVYSIPSFMFKHSGGLRLSSSSAPEYRRQTAHFQGFATLLERLHVPYEVVIFGGERSLWDDSETLHALRAYRLVVLPNLEAMTDQQARALRAYLHQGGRVLFSGRAGVRDEMFARLPKPRVPELARRGLVRVGDGCAFGLGDEPAQLGAAAHVLTGAVQFVHVNQAKPELLVVSAWSKAEGVAGAGPHYSLWIDVEYQDGARGWFGVAPFRSGTHEWQRVEKRLHPRKPIRIVKLYLLLRYALVGTAWFDDVSVTRPGRNENMVKNPGFENDEGWKSYGKGFEWDERVAHTGRRSIRCTIPRQSLLDRAAAARIRAALDRLLPASERLIETKAPPEVYVNPLLQRDRIVLHFLNMDWRRSDDTVAEKQNVRVKLHLVSGRRASADTAHFASPDFGDGILPLRADRDAIAFTLPRLRVWTVVRLDIGR